MKAIFKEEIKQDTVTEPSNEASNIDNHFNSSFKIPLSISKNNLIFSSKTNYLQPFDHEGANLDLDLNSEKNPCNTGSRAGAGDRRRQQKKFQNGSLGREQLTS